MRNAIDRFREFHHNNCVVSYEVAQWHPNDGPYYDTFADDIVVYQDGEDITESLSDFELAEIKEACSEDMIDRFWGFEE